MSGIYFPDMGMPKSCYDCPLQDDECFGSIKCRYAKTWGSANMRAVDCPLILVPNHGRLVDADVLDDVVKVRNKREYNTWHYITRDDYKLVESLLLEFPTIISASDKET